MQRRRRAVVADIGGEAALRGERVEPLRVGALMDEAALLEDAQEVGAEGGHACDLVGGACQFRAALTM